MKVLVLTTGRTGSMSLFRACQHVKNFTTGHDSKSGQLAVERVQTSDQHIEIDTRFAWFLGRIAECDNGDTHYVHLTRNSHAIATSYNRRWANRKGIMRSYCEGLLERDKPSNDAKVATDLVETVEANIKTFLIGRPHSTITLENVAADLPLFFDAINAEVDVAKALAEFEHRHNHSRKLSAFTRTRFKLSLAFDALERLLFRLRKQR